MSDGQVCDDDVDCQVAEYLPSIQQDRSEFEYLLHDIARLNLVSTKCLQLGLGDGCSHEVWECIFRTVFSIEIDPLKAQRFRHPGRGVIIGDTREAAKSLNFFMKEQQTDLVDFLFIDAGHLYEDVRRDYYEYSPFVRSGGIIAFHDALPRDGFPGIEVHKFLGELNRNAINIVGTEVGTAWMVKQ